MRVPVHHVALVPHHRRFAHVPTLPILLEHGGVEIQSGVVCLVIQRHHLNPKGPEDHWVEVRGVDAHASRVRSNQLCLCVRNDAQRLLPADLLGCALVQGGALEASWHSAVRSETDYEYCENRFCNSYVFLCVLASRLTNSANAENLRFSKSRLKSRDFRICMHNFRKTIVF